MSPTSQPLHSELMIGGHVRQGAGRVMPRLTGTVLRASTTMCTENEQIGWGNQEVGVKTVKALRGPVACVGLGQEASEESGAQGSGLGSWVDSEAICCNGRDPR